jgi:hypothetical protein
MWKVKTEVTIVTVRVTGAISKSLRLYLNNRTVKHEIKELQKTTILGTAHLLREVLM